MKLRPAAVLTAFALSFTSVGLVTSSAQAAPVTTTVDGISFSADSDNVAAGATATGYDVSAGTSVSIPSRVTIDTTTYDVKRIGSRSFQQLGLTSVVFPDTLTTVESYAFQGNLLTTVTIPDSVTTIGGIAFYNNRLTDVTFGDKVATIGNNSFAFNQLTTIELPASLHSIQLLAFANNPALAQVRLHGQAPSVTNSSTFGTGDPLVKFPLRFGADLVSDGYTTPTWHGYRSQGVPRVSFDGNGAGASTTAPQDVEPGDTASQPAAPTRDGYTFRGWFTDAAATHPFDFSTPITDETVVHAGWGPLTVDGFTYTTEGTQASVTGYVGTPPADLVIPATVTGGGVTFTVTTIGPSAFKGKGLTSLDLPDTITATGFDAFSTNNLTEIALPSSLRTVGPRTFELNSLTHVTVPDSVTAIDFAAFGSNPLASVDLGTGVTTIDTGAFSGGKLTTLVIPSNVTTLGDFAFSNNRLTELTLSPGLITIGSFTFYENSLTSVTIPPTVTLLRNLTFENNPLDEVHFTGPAPTLGHQALSSHDPLVRFPWRYGAGQVDGGYESPSWLDHRTQAVATVTFDGNGEGASSTDEQLVDVGDTADEPAEPTRSGYDFRDWFATADATGEAVGLPTTITRDTTFFAGWGHAPALDGATAVDLELGEDITWTPTALTGTPDPGVAVTAGTLPDGLALDADTGVVSGAVTDPAQIGDHPVTLSAINDAGTDTVDVTFTVAAGPVDVLALSASSTTVTAGDTVTVTATGTNASGFDLGDVTAGTTFTSDVPGDLIDGNTITVEGASTHTITGTNGSATQQIAIEVRAKPAPPQPTPPSAGPDLSGLSAKISGTPREGKTLRAKPAGVASGTTIRYRWLANGRTIAGATGPTLKLGKRQAARRISVRVTASAQGSTTVTKTSARTRPVASAKRRLVLSTYTVKHRAAFRLTSTGLRPGQRYTIWLGGRNTYTGKADRHGVVDRTVRYSKQIAPGTRRVRVSGYATSGKRTSTVYTHVRYLKR